jgi:hypothetical protein
MEHKDRKARIVNWENDGAYIEVLYTQEDGQRVEAMFKRIGWNRAPAEVVSTIMDALACGPQTVAGRLNRPSS